MSIKKDVETFYPLSPMQQGMLFHTLYDAGSGMYVEQLSVSLEGEMQVAAFQQAWERVVKRHSIFRTAFLWDGLKTPVQVVHRRVEVPWELDDWRALSADEQASRLTNFLDADRARGYDMTQPPLMRFALFRLSADTHQFVWSQHHLLLDGWSLPLVLSEVFRLYEAFVQGQDLALPQPRPYHEYIAWLQRQDLQAAEHFWRRALAGISGPTPLGIDRPAELASQTPGYEEIERHLPIETGLSLRDLARQHGLTLNTIMQGAWALLLGCYSGERDVVFGATVAGRPAELPGVETMVGLFINTLPVRVQLLPEQPLLEWLKLLQSQQTELRQYEYSPLVEVQGWSEVPRGQPLFESLVVFENYPATGGDAGPAQRPRLSMGQMQAVERTNYPLNLMAGAGALRINYDRQRFDRPTIERLLVHFQTILTTLLRQPSQPLGELLLLSEAERARLRDWNTTAAAYPDDQCLHELVAAQAARTPDAIAVAYEQTTLSYAELDRRANQLAQHLHALGVQPDARVALCVERSLDAAIALLGILKAGAAYVPLDPAYPQERLQFMLDDARVAALVTQQALLARLPERVAVLPVVCLDSDAATIAQASAADPQVAVTPDHLAYVIYTSGSTGTPKGVAMPHRPLVNLVAWHQHDPAFATPRRTLQFAPLSFDVSCQEFLTTWSTGGTLVLIADPIRRDASMLVRLINEQRIERIFMPFVALQNLAEVVVAEGATTPHLRQIVTAGEQLQITPALRQWLSACQECQLYNHYGPTESHVITAFMLTGAPADWPQLPAIGVPIANAQAYILDDRTRPVPVGVPGELHLGGIALARGYLDRPALTAERFRPDPFSDRPGARLYRTGDLARYQADGNIEFLTRTDAQVKVRGYRIETGEIEAALLAHPDVREAVVLARADKGSEKRLVAYVVSGAAQDAPAAGALRSFLQTKLPDYMVPSAFVTLAALPLTPSGKIDRRALPAPDSARPELTSVFAAPRTPIEEILSQVWAEVLRLERVGIHDSFFDLGGHSLLATQLISRVREACQIELPLRALFEASTVAALAERITQARYERPELAPPPIQPVPRDRPLPASFAQQRLWFFDQLQPNNTAYNLTTPIRLHGALDFGALEQSLSAIVQRHETLRTTFRTINEQPVQIIHPHAPLELALIDLQFLPDEERLGEALQMATEEAQTPFDLQRGPLLRTTLLRLAEDDHLLLLNMHHIVADGWSIGVFMGELTALYRAFCADLSQPVERVLPALPVQYADYAVWQQQWLDPDSSGNALDSQLAYWRKQLAGTPVLQLPTDRPRPAVAVLEGAVIEFTLPQPLTEALVALSRREGATLFMTLLTAWQLLLARYSGQSDIAVGTPIAGRTRAETEALIGYFLNTLVLRTNLAEAVSFRDALQRVREVCLQAYAHQDLPFEQVVNAVQPERDLSRHALFQVMFVLQNAPQAALELPGLIFSPVTIERTTTRFDLTLTMMERPEGLVGALEYSTGLFETATIERLIAHFSTLLRAIAAQPAQPFARLALLTEAEQEQLRAWNATATDVPQDHCIHELIAAQAARTPDAIAVVYEDQTLSYAALEERANLLAQRLRALGVGPDIRVGVYMERSLDLIVGLLGILKAGGAYLPLDPAYPSDRIQFMISDSQTPVLLTQERLLRPLSARLPEGQAQIVCLDADWPAVAPATTQLARVTPDNLAYVIYTSGSTGTPKGVMVPHRSVINFFVGMDQRLGAEPGSWLAVTSISFDISVLELFWTLSRGFKVIVQGDDQSATLPQSALPEQPIDFSLFYFASDDRVAADKYRLLLEGAKFADQHGFAAVWTPERHFHSFGGLYPNPSVTSAAVATITQRVQIRAGSVVLPLHSPIRVAEEWSVVDNLSHGRVGISFASGWHADDFVLAPQNFAGRKAVMLEQIEMVRRLWRGEALPFAGGAGNEVPITIVPRPVQPELPIWITASGAPDTFRLAGELGANVLTHLLGQTIEGLEEKIALYRQTWDAHGHPSGGGQVTLMLHTFIGQDREQVREQVRQPFREYLRGSLDLIGNLVRSLGHDPSAQDVASDDLEAILDYAFDRYFETNSLMGTPASAIQLIDRLKRIGVDEVGCLIDFGVDAQSVLASLDDLALVKEHSNPREQAADYGLAAQLTRHQASHLQCTPSLMRMLTLDPEAFAALGTLNTLMLGGEALPAALATQLRAALPATIHNMYGPTETTIWSTTHRLDRDAGSVPLGQPIANTQIHILDRQLQPQPIGVPGELYIGGAGVVRGYLARPALTAERFIPDPCSGLNGIPAGARLYKTGDLARWRTDGTLEFLGRIDTQVKLRGYRIETGEIEAVLLKHTAVSEAAVLVREDALLDSAQPEQRLVAYLVPVEQGQVISLVELRRFLQAQLPSYMIPEAVVILDALPLTPNGKLDRSALPAPASARPDMDDSYVAPRTPLEEIVANIWADLLRIEQVGVHDNFFSLGGNSLMATLLISRLRESLGVELPVRVLFESPTVTGLVERLQQRHTGEVSQIPPLVPVARTATLPLSFAQQRLWFINQIQPESWSYNEPIALRLGGPMELPALEGALNTLVRRHETLRTTFPVINGQPAQVISAYQPQPLQLIDISGMPEDRRTAEAERLAGEEARALFDLQRGPIFRTTLLRLDSTDHVVLLTMHHIVCDGWSKSVIIRELTELYNSAVEGRAARLEELPIQYADYAVWQRSWLHGPVLQHQLDYWQRQLADLSVLQLPTDHPRPTIPTFQGSIYGFKLPREIGDAMATLSRREGATLFMTLLAAWQVLLARYSSQDDVIVGTPIAGRSRHETEGLIGFFVNTLVLRTNLGGDPSFRELLQRVREVCLQAYSYQDLPFEQVVEAVQPDRDLSRQPLFQVIFSVQDIPRVALELPDLTLSPLLVEQSASKFDLELSLAPTDDGLIGSLIYSTDLFEGETVARMMGALEALLHGIAADPDQPISALPLLTETEQQQIIGGWNATATDYPRDRCVHELVAAQAARTPDAPAVVFGSETLSYGELNRRANQLAHHLQALGVRPGDYVGICLQRSSAFVIGVLSILKAGGAYVPLDPGYPAERIRFMLDDTAIRVLITVQPLSDLLPTHGGQTVLLDQDWNAIAAQPDTNPVNRVTAQHLAYLIYTSGSTGTPKGSAVPHQAIVRLVCETNYVQLTPDDRIAFVSNTSFDAATFELWGALVHGARLVGVARETMLDPQLFAAHIREQQLTTMFVTTALFNQLARSEPTAFATMREVMFGGEAVDPRWVAEVLAHGGPQRLLHVYGPTESTTFATWHLIEDVAEQATTIPIGRPLANTRCYLLDARLQPQPVGVPGELYIGGDGLALFYHNRPALTAERFIPDPCSGQPGARLYKTGDLARWLPDGSIEFLGRNDDQIKLRGFRIEPDEIATVIAEYPAVQQSIVLVKQDRTSGGAAAEKRLVAYIVPQPTQTLALSDLRSFLLSRLPDYMLPHAFVTLETLPINANGKVDRQALLALDSSSAGLGGNMRSDSEPFIAPRDALEFQLTHIWEELLEVHPISVTDNFFVLGGHSLRMIQMASAIEQRIGLKLPLAAIFQHPTIEEIACYLREHTTPLPWSPLVPIQPAGTQRPIFFVHPAGGTAFCYMPLAQQLGPDQPFYGLQSYGFEVDQSPLTTVEAMAEHYLEAVRQVQPEGPYVLGGWSLGGVIALEMAQQLQRQHQQVSLLMVLDSDLAPPELQTPDADLSKYLNDAAVLMLMVKRENLPMTPEEFEQLPADEQLAVALEVARRTNIIPPDASAEYVQRVMGVLKANFAALLMYRPQLYTGTITYLQSEMPVDDTIPQREDPSGADPYRGWQHVSAQPLDLHTVRGDHMSILSVAHVERVAEILRTCLDRTATHTSEEHLIAETWAED